VKQTIEFYTCVGCLIVIIFIDMVTPDRTIKIIFHRFNRRLSNTFIRIYINWIVLFIDNNEKFSKIFRYFLRRGGNINVTVTGDKFFNIGLEVPCTYTFSGSNTDIEKLKTLLK
jgi:hypothetical protein